MNLAFEETLLRGRVEGESPDTLRLWQHPPVVSVGCYQNPKEEVDLEKCKQYGIKIIKRLSPGGSLYIDEGSLQYSLALDRNSISLPEKIEDSYSIFSNGVIETLSFFGIHAEFKPINDIVVNRRKISGASQSRMYNGILHHGTISINTRLDILEQVLKPSEIKLRAQGFQKLRDRVTTLNQEIGKIIPINIFKEELIKSFQKTLNTNFEKCSPTTWEMKMAERLYNEKYKRLEWIYSETEKNFDILSNYRIAKGVIKISLSIDDDRIKDLNISGDFIIHPEQAISKLEENLKGEFLIEENLIKRIKETFSTYGIQALGANEEDFAKAIMLAYLGSNFK
jgi:lipoate-protein ligase A